MRLLWWGILAALALVLTGCASTDDVGFTENPATTGSLQCGAGTAAFSTLVSPDGAWVPVPSGPLQGLTFKIPAGSYPDARTLQVSYAEIFGHTFNPAFRPITPLIIIDNGGGYASHIMQVTIPVAIPAGHFALPLLYDEARQRLESLPIVAESPSAVTVAVRHFAGARGAETTSRIVVSAIAEAELPNAFSAFQPGWDDLAAPNDGTVFTPDGQASGQSLAALWYFVERALTGAPRLRKQFAGESAILWQDDAAGIQWASVLQDTANWSALWAECAATFADTPDSVTWKACGYSLLLTGAPQGVYLGRPSGTPLLLIAYKAKDGQLYLADPAAPGDSTRAVAFTGTTFAAYQTAETALGVPRAYDRIRHLGQAALLPWPQAADLWDEAADGTIGARFPPTALWRVPDGGAPVPLDPSQALAQEAVTLAATVDSVDAGLTVYSAAGATLASGTAVSVPLVAGSNRLGLCVHAGATCRDRWAGFTWITLHRQ